MSDRNINGPGRRRRRKRRQKPAAYLTFGKPRRLGPPVTRGPQA